MSEFRSPPRPFAAMPRNGTAPRTIPAPFLTPEDWKYLLILDQAEVSRRAAEIVCLRLVGAAIPSQQAARILADEAQRVATEAVEVQPQWWISGFDQEIAETIKRTFASRVHELTNGMTQWGLA
jgi:hypothetical protein